MAEPTGARIRVGVVGVGWGALVHVPAFRAVPEFEVVGLCARSRSRLDPVAERFGITDLSTDWESFVRRDDLDLVVVATPASTHRDMAVAALESGHHVLCEKPLATTAAEAAEMAAAAARSRRATATCFELTWTADRLPVTDLVAGGFLGEPYFVRLAQSGAYWHPTHKAQNAWMYDLEAGGGYLNGMVVHDIDWVCRMFGEPRALCADVRSSIDEVTLRDGSTVPVTGDDTSVVLLRMESGALVELSSSVVGAHTAGWRFEAFGREGTIVSTGGRGPRSLRVGAAGDPEGLVDPRVSERVARSGVAWEERGATAMAKAQALMLEDWLPAFGGEPTRVPTFHDGWRAQRVIEAARESSAGAGWVEI
ncbi:Gfo/Idh/MocA family protein [Pseudonocardia pini]|uniref:Gfo/Idh/MocA family protein n=1 Tax=Pseudonocardia pini TaxID=2758030 RepID=UPI0015F0182C|nr:Gfo/Idh/MocA family oxidoreductase [Pseudonocardia pini]